MRFNLVVGTCIITVFIGVFGPACTYGIFRNVYTVVFDSSIHTVLTHAILNAKTATAETFQLVPYLIDHHNYIATNFCYMAFKNKLTALRGATACKGLKQQYMAGQLDQPILLLVEACSGSLCMSYIINYHIHIQHIF